MLDVGQKMQVYTMSVNMQQIEATPSLISLHYECKA